MEEQASRDKELDAIAGEALEVAQEGIAFLKAGTVRWANRRFGELLGLPAQDLMGAPAASLVSVDEEERFRQWLAMGPESEPFQLAPDRPDTPERIELTWKVGPSDPPQTGWLLALDVTATYREREAARQRAELLERIARLVPYFLFVYDYELGRDVYINRPVPQALGYSDEEAARLGPYPFLHLCHPDDLGPALERDARWRNRPADAIDSVEFRLRDRSGVWRWFRSYNLAFERDAEERVIRMLGLSEEITETKRAQEVLRQQDRLDTIGLMAAGLAHDLGNLLTPLGAHAELVLAELGDSSGARRHALALARSIARARELVEELFLVAGRGEHPNVPVDLNRVVEEAVSLIEARTDSPQIELNLAQEIPAVPGDSTQLGQVVCNLLANACDAMHGRSGRIEVRTRMFRIESPAELRNTLLGDRLAPGPTVLLEVQDQGVGMNEEMRARLFEPFSSSKPTGRGLGLAATMGILRRHGAGIHVDSTPGVGSCFRIFFPTVALAG